MLLNDTTKFSKDASWLNAQSVICNGNGYLLANLHSRLEMNFIAQQLMKRFPHINNKAAFIGSFFTAHFDCSFHHKTHLFNITEMLFSCKKMKISLENYLYFEYFYSKHRQW